jgi:hypothetical protein
MRAGLIFCWPLRNATPANASPALSAMVAVITFPVEPPTPRSSTRKWRRRGG